MALINFDYQQSMRQVQTLRSVSDEISALAHSALGPALEDLQANWTGDAATLYLKKGEDLQRDIQKTARKIAEIAEAIHRAAGQILKIEQEAKIIVQNFVGS